MKAHLLKHLAWVIPLLFLNSRTKAQTCGNELLHQVWQAQDPKWQENVYQTRQLINQQIASGNTTASTTSFNPNALIIPVVVHVLHPQGQAYGTGQNISYLQIKSQIDALNAAFGMDYNAYNGQLHGPHAVNTNIQFCLATIPQGASAWTDPSEPGVMRYALPSGDPLLNNQMTWAGSTALLGLTHPTNAHFPFANYMNIWTVPQINSGNSIIGYAPEPIMSPWPLDGVVIRSDAFGDNTTGGGFILSGLQQGKVMAHEVGHYLSLWHTFHNGCTGTNNNDCSTNGDFICDTPPVHPDSIYYNCSGPIPNSCTDNLTYFSNLDTTDMTENYMSYSHDVCMNTFTNGQSLSMNAWISLSRSNLVSSSNLAATGVSNTNGCIGPLLLADIQYGSSQICDSTPVQFSTPWGSSYAAVSWSWIFQGGTPATSTAQNPVVTYNTQGTYPVILTAYDASNNSVSDTIYISVSGCQALASTQGNWYFGHFAGLSFASGTPVADLNAWTHQTTDVIEGVVNESDTAGNLLFYYNGYGIWNRDHEPIATNIIPPNTQYNTTDNSTAQLLSVPFPGHPGQYYLFYLPVSGNANGVHYSIVDMNLTCTTCPSQGPGQLVVTNALLFNTSAWGDRLGEGITAVPHCNGHDYWIVAMGGDNSQSSGSARIYVWLLTAGGISAPTITPMNIDYFQSYGCIKASPDGSKIAAVQQGSINQNRVTLWNFNNSTGVLSSPLIISSLMSYGVSFSPNSQLFYFSSGNKIYQYEIASGNTIQVGALPQTNQWIGSMQLGPEPGPGKKLYTSINAALNTINDRLGVVQNPDMPGTGCAFTANGPLLDPTAVGIRSKMGLPNMIDAAKPPAVSPTYTYTLTNCSTAVFSIDPCWSQYTASWNFGDPASGPANTSTAHNPTHVFSGNGTFTVTLTLSIGSFSFPAYTQTISILNAPPAINGPSSFCTNQQLATYSVLSSQTSGFSYAWTVTGGGSIQGNTNLNSIQVSWTGSGTVVCTLTNGACTLVSSLNVIVNPSPVVFAGNDTAYCTGGPGVTLPATVSGGTPPYTFLWSPASGLSSTTVLNPVATPSATTSYSLLVTDANGCTATDAVIVTQGGQAPPVTFSAIPAPVCDLINNYDLTPYGSPAGGVFSGPGVSGNLFDATGLNAGTYQLVYTWSNGTCSNTDTQTVTVTTNCCAGIATSAIPIGGQVNANTVYSAPFYIVTSDLMINSGVTVNFPASVSKVKFMPGVKVVVSSGGTLAVAQSHWYACTDAWTGIVLKSGSNLFLNGTWIEDAHTAVNSVNGFAAAANFQIQGAIFNKNYKAVEVTDWNNGLHPGTINGSVVTCRVMPQNPTASMLTPAFLLGQAATSLVNPLHTLSTGSTESQTGVFMRNMNYFTVGDPSAASNTFDNLDYGVWAVNSTLKVLNGRFQEIRGRNYLNGPANTPSPGAGVVAVDTHFVSGNAATYNTVTVGGPGTAANSFFNCARAVDITNYYDMTVTDNTIDNTTTSSPLASTNIIGRAGVTVRNFHSNIMVIDDNVISNVMNGILVNRSNNAVTSANISIRDNHIFRHGTADVREGIYIMDGQANSVVNSSGTIFIEGNKVVNSRNCIRARLIRSPLKIQHNDSLQVIGTTSAGSGVAVELCTDAVVYNNIKIRSGNISNLNIRGIYAQQGSNLRVTCNRIDSTGRGLMFQGSIPATAARRNKLNYTSEGLVLFSNGDIGIQGASNSPSDNTWSPTTGFFSSTRPHTASYSSPAAPACSLYCRQTGAYNPINHNGTPAMADYNAMGLTLLCPAVQVGSYNKRQMWRIAADSTVYAGDTAKARWLARKSLFWLLLQNDSLKAGDSLLQAFFNQSLQGNLGKLDSIATAIAQRNYTLAASLTTSLQPANDIETRYKTFYGHYITWLRSTTRGSFNFTLGADPRAATEAIAGLCPILYGEVVYLARNWIAYLDNEVKDYDSDCDGVLLRQGSSEDEGLSEAGPENNVAVYPNPNSGQMTIAYMLAEPGMEHYFILYDALGREAGRYRLPAGNTSLTITADLVPGIYVYKVVHPKAVIAAGRISIIR